MTRLVVLTVTMLLFSSVRPVIDAPPVTKPEYVYICVSRTAYVYHKTKECRGLSRCTHEIKKITKKEAVDDYGRRACKVCY